MPQIRNQGSQRYACHFRARRRGLNDTGPEARVAGKYGFELREVCQGTAGPSHRDDLDRVLALAREVTLDGQVALFERQVARQRGYSALADVKAEHRYRRQDHESSRQRQAHGWTAHHRCGHGCPSPRPAGHPTCSAQSFFPPHSHSSLKPGNSVIRNWAFWVRCTPPSGTVSCRRQREGPRWGAIAVLRTAVMGGSAGFSRWRRRPGPGRWPAGCRFPRLGAARTGWRAGS
jgi:hypothetical protein